jgi:hypothetical protein
MTFKVSMLELAFKVLRVGQLESLEVRKAALPPLFAPPLNFFQLYSP